MVHETEATIKNGKKAFYTNEARKPKVIQVNPNGIPVELRERPQWVAWRLKWKGKEWSKVPIDPATGRNASCDDPTSWGTFAAALQRARSCDGIGYEFSADDPNFGIDFDNAVDANRALKPWASDIVSAFRTYTEFSPSITGCKLFGRGRLPTECKHKIKFHDGEIEVYDCNRYFTVTGLPVSGTPADISECQAELDKMLDRCGFLKAPPTTTASNGKYSGSLSDYEIVQKAKAANTTGPIFSRLWNGDGSDYDNDRSKCDYHLCKFLAWWFHGDEAAIDRNFRQSGLMREKWDRVDYRERTIRKAVEACEGSFYEPGGHGPRVVWGSTQDEPDYITIDGEEKGDAYEGSNSATDESEFAPPPPPPPENDDTDKKSTQGGTPGEDKRTILRYTARQLIQQFPELKPRVIGDLLRQGETANIISLSKFGKTWLSYGLALCKVTGRKWLDRFEMPRGRVMIIDNELHRQTIASRIKTVADAMKIGIDEYADDLEYISLRGRLMDIFKLEVIINTFKNGEFDLINLDAKYRMMPLSASENSNSDETRFYNQLDRYTEKTGAAISAVHHASKGMQGDKRVTDVGAGAGAQSRAADCHIVLREHEDDNVAVLEAVTRSFAPVQPLAIRWQFPLWIPDDHSDPTKLKGKMSYQDENQRKKDNEGIGKIKDHLGKLGKATRKKLIKLTGFGYERIVRLLAMMIEQGDATCIEGDDEKGTNDVYELVNKI